MSALCFGSRLAVRDHEREVQFHRAYPELAHHLHRDSLPERFASQLQGRRIRHYAHNPTNDRAWSLWNDQLDAPRADVKAQLAGAQDDLEQARRALSQCQSHGAPSPDRAVAPEPRLMGVGFAIRRPTSF